MARREALRSVHNEWDGVSNVRSKFGEVGGRGEARAATGFAAMKGDSREKVFAVAAAAKENSAATTMLAGAGGGDVTWKRQMYYHKQQQKQWHRMSSGGGAHADGTSSVASSAMSNSPIYVGEDDDGRSKTPEQAAAAHSSSSSLRRRGVSQSPTGAHNSSSRSSSDAPHSAFKKVTTPPSASRFRDAIAKDDFADGDEEEDEEGNDGEKENDIGRSYAAQLRACMRQFHAARKRRQQAPTLETRTSGEAGSSTPGRDAGSGGGGRSDAAAGMSSSSRSSSARFEYEFFHAGGEESIVARLQRLQRSLSDGLSLDLDAFDPAPTTKTTTTNVRGSTDHDEPRGSAVKHTDDGETLKQTDVLHEPGSAGGSSKKNARTFLEDYVWTHDEDDDSDESEQEEEEESSRIHRSTHEILHADDGGDSHHGNDDDVTAQTSPASGGYLSAFSEDIAGVVGASRKEQGQHQRINSGVKSAWDAQYNNEIGGTASPSPSPLASHYYYGVSAKNTPSIRQMQSAGEPVRNGEHDAADQGRCVDDDDNDGAPSTPKASFGFDPVHGDDDEYGRAVTETVMKAKLMTERIESEKKKARRGTPSKPGEAYADSVGTENAGIGMADAGPGIVAKLRSALERATHAATATTLKLSQVEEEQGTQQLLLHAAMQRQAELLRTLETTKAEAAQSKEETTALSNRLAAALTELEKSQADVSDEHAKLRSARAALAEMASQNARLVSGYSEKKGLLRKRQAELDALTRERDALRRDKAQIEEEHARLQSETKGDGSGAYGSQAAAEKLDAERRKWEAERQELRTKLREVREELDAAQSARRKMEEETKKSKSSIDTGQQRSEGGGATTVGDELRADRDRLAARVESLEREASERRRDAEAHRRYRSAEQHKSRGNSLFHTKKYQEAHDEYTLGIEAAASAGSDGDGSDGDSRLKAMLHSNRAAASQHLGRYCDAIVDCCIALEVDASYTRALQRRAEAFIAMQHYEGAFADLGRLAQLGDAEAAASLPEARRRARRSAELDHYAVLNLPANATNAQIKSSYKELALRLHPDKAKTGGEREAANCLFKHVTEARNVLMSPGQRRRFDAGKMLSRTSRSGHHSHHHH